MASLKLTVRPSKMELTRACLGSVEAQAPYPYESSEAADRGKALHDAMALLFQAGDTPQTWAQVRATLGANPLIKPEDIERLPEVYRLGRAQEPEGTDVIMLVEKQLDLDFMNMTGGKPDLVFISPTHGAAVIVDWKFGSRQVEDPETNAQMQDYGAGILAWAKKNLDLEIKVVEGVVIQPFGQKIDDWYRSHTWTVDELRTIAAQDKEIATMAKVPGQPRIAGPHCVSGWCNARKPHMDRDGQIDIPACQAYLDYAAGKKAEKQEAQAAAIRTVTAGTAITVEPQEGMQFPIVVISAEVVEKAQALKSMAMSILVTDENSAETAGRLSKEIRSNINLIETHRENVKRPVLLLGRMIDNAAKMATDDLKAADNHLMAQNDAHVKRKQEALRKAEAEEAKRKHEAELAQAKAKEEEHRKAAEAAEARQRELEANLKAEQAKGKAAKEKAEKEAAAARAQAQEAERKAEDERRRQADIDQQAREAAAALERAREDAEKKITGVSQRTETTWEIPDVSKVPAQWAGVILVPDKKAIDALVKAGKLTEKNGAGWIEIKREMVAARSR